MKIRGLFALLLTTILFTGCAEEKADPSATTAEGPNTKMGQASGVPKMSRPPGAAAPLLPGSKTGG